MSRGAEVLVLFAVQHMHVPRRPADSARVAPVRVPVLQQGSRVWAERSQAEGAEGCPTGQAGVRGHVHDRGQGLGGRTHIRTDHHRSHPGN